MHIRYQPIPADMATPEPPASPEKLGSFADAFITYLISEASKNAINLIDDTENSISINTILALSSTCMDLNARLRNDKLWEAIAKRILKEPGEATDQQLSQKEMVMSSIRLADVKYHKNEYLRANHIVQIDDPCDDICDFSNPASDCSRNTCQSLVGTFGSIGFLGGAIGSAMQANGPCIPFFATACKFACYSIGGGVLGLGAGGVAGMAIYGTVEGCRYTIHLHQTNQDKKHNAAIQDQLNTYDRSINDLAVKAFDLNESCTLEIQSHSLKAFSLFKQPAEIRMIEDDEMNNKNAHNLN